ncbi:MAG: aminotransferase class I/II-fold pyridoxal phosphate-dependent enzyme [Treponema sp.]|nr:aminotransferase class I/II-fold pyridoxal phosphate-dependent enzyme [Treponema sp.]
MQAIILAAGMGTRLGSLTAENTKCMVKVNGVTLIERLLLQLEAFSLSRIVIVSGYQGKKMQDFVLSLGIRTEIVFVDNPVYASTNNIYSLYLVRDYLLREDTMLFESDTIFDDRVIKSLYSDVRPTLALVDKYESWMDGTVVRLSEDDTILDVIPGKEFNFADMSSYYKTVNVYKFSKDFSGRFYVPFLEAYIHAVGKSQYYENVLRILTVLGDTGIHAKRLEGEKWYEIDDIQDLDIASTLFSDGQAELDMFQHAYGGYWRFPKMLDFCYLVNPYYPPKKLMNEMQASFVPLLTQYPSGMARNRLLAAKNYGVEQRHIVVGNGAAELIKSLLSLWDAENRAFGFIRPTFEEYPHRLHRGVPEEFTVRYPDFRYTAEDLITFFSEHPVYALFLINPDNPSGNYIPQSSVRKLAAWAEQQHVRLVLDESFIDFSEEKEASVISESYFQEYPHLVVVKSISKSHGVPGIRLGVLASADEDLICSISSDVSIWNINSFGEFYMQIAGKYKKDYAVALEKYRQEKAAFVASLSSLHGLRPLPSQANFVMCELCCGMSSGELAQRLLSDYKIFIKDLSAKIADGRQYIRLAVRSSADNGRLLAALRSIL